MTGRLAGQIALVTGAGPSDGIGAATVRRLAHEGAAVLATDLPHLAEQGQRYCGKLGAEGYRVEFESHDVTSEADWSRAVATCRSRFGAPTVLVNNAGTNSTADFLDETIENWHRVIDVNLTGPYLGMRAVVPDMLSAGSGSIVNISSVTGLIVSPPVPGRANSSYHASKGGLTVLSKVAAVRYAQEGIRVNSVHPGPIETGMMKRGGRGSILVDRTPIARMAAPSEVAAVVAFLASSEASYVTGAAIAVDGGYMAI